MRTMAKWVLGSLALLGLSTTAAWAGPGSWSVGVRIGVPAHPRPWYAYDPYPYYYRPYRVYVPAPVYVAPPPVYVAPAPVVFHPTAAPYGEPAPAPRTVPARAVSAVEERHPETDRLLRQLGDSDERVRLDTVAQLGRMKLHRAIDPLAASLSGDRSPAVREAAARALGLIGSPKALPALQHAAQADSDSYVRHSARFAAEVIQSYR